MQSVGPPVDAFRLQAFLDAIVFLIDAYAYFVINALHCLCVFLCDDFVTAHKMPQKDVEQHCRTSDFLGRPSADL